MRWFRAWPSALVLALLLGCAASPQRAAVPDGNPTAPPAAPRRPADPAAYLHTSMAHMYAQAGRMNEAIAELKKAIERDGRSPTLWVLLARWQGRQENYSEAIAAAQKAIALDARLPAAHIALAELYHAQKKDTEAAQALEEAIRLDPPAPEPYELLARYYFEGKDGVRARTG